MGGDAAARPRHTLGRDDFHPGRGAAGHDQAFAAGERLPRPHRQRAHGKRARAQVGATGWCNRALLIASCKQHTASLDGLTMAGNVENEKSVLQSGSADN